MLDRFLKTVAEGTTHFGQKGIIASELNGREVSLFVHGMLDEDDFPQDLLEKAAREISQKELTQASKEYAEEIAQLEKLQSEYNKKRKPSAQEQREAKIRQTKLDAAAEIAKQPHKVEKEIRARARLKIIKLLEKEDQNRRPEKYKGPIKNYDLKESSSMLSPSFWSQPVGRTGAGKIVSGLSVAELAVILGVLILVPGANVQAILALALVGVIGLAIGIPLAVTSTKTPTTTA